MAIKPTYEELEQKIEELELKANQSIELNEKLRKSDELFEKTFISQRDAIFILDSEFPPKIIDCNPAAVEAFGYTRQEILGRSTAFLHSDKTTLKKFQEDLYPSVDDRGYYHLPEFEMKKKDGIIFATEHSVFPLQNEQGIRIGWVSVIRDITKRKLAEDALRESEDRYKSLFKNNHSVMLLIDPKSANIVDANPAATAFYGWGYKELTRMKITDINTLTERKVFQEMKRAKTEHRQHFYFQHRLANGDIRNVEVYSGPIQLRGQQLLYSIVHDITERKKMEEALLESEGKYKFLTENMVDIVWILDRDFQTTYVSSSIEEVLGFTVEERKQQTLEEMITPESLQSVQMKFLEELQRDEDSVSDPDRSVTIEIEYYRKDGSTVWMENSIKAIRDPAGEIIGMHGVSRDITKRKKAEEALRESEERFRCLTESSPLGVFQTDKDGNVLYLNNKWLAITGMSLQDALGLGWAQALPPEDRSRLLAEWAKCLEEKKGYDGEFRFVRPSGETRWVHTRTSPVFSTAGDVISHVGVNEDTTDRKQAEKALRESQEKYKSLTNNLNVGVYRNTIGSKGKFIEANPAIVKMFGYDSRDEFLEVIVSDLYQKPGDREKYNKKILKEGTVKNEELRLRKKNGSPIICSVSAVAVRDKNGEVKYFDGIIEDISKRKQAEEALRESEEKLARSKKMASLGLLAGGVAHDLNNVLSGIVGYPELILRDLPEDSKLMRPIEIMQESGHRAAAIVDDLLTVARGVATTKEPLNLNDLIGDYLNSPEFNKLEQFHPTVTIKTNLDTDLFKMSGSHIHIRKLVMNLVSNASEAIDGSGNVIISTMNSYIDRPLRGYDDVSIGEYVVLAVSDDGPGISSDDLERIFEPFYTKKVMGRSGTGLGLSVVWNVVQDHKGYIDVTTDENGTTFELYFPITREEITDKGLSKPIKDYKGDGETILVVDDVESQREIACKMLETLGYKTQAVSSGEEAVEYLKENSVDLILLDMIMDPGINGREAYERIIEIHPKQKAIIVSGFAETDDVKEAQKLGAGQYIKKPLTLEKIGIAIRDELKKEPKL